MSDQSSDFLEKIMGVRKQETIKDDLFTRKEVILSGR